ncbi:Serine phosphatase RsbU, regulator of sigma subunit [Labilithrix luteola]|uniref:Serine phosphatase RsbU, regulator of sigma subunit n=1 Tax=Labilithrix luteola TaxID=1391654 RepID=A0A0K1PVF5_9BACT|nr:PP2C family protein-serine/threonine phosphatase [Labilithrix luteola]AKU97109.1 Serine phosphatase RsbU, regulator of sigma subunit [Labilithrix luteola]
MRRSLEQIKQSALIAWPLLGAVACLLLLAWQSVEIMNGAHSYLTGESTWSKGQKDAIYQVVQYARTHDETDYVKFEAAIAIPLGDRKARLALEQSVPDYATARLGFLEGQNSPEDVDGIIMIYRRFRSTSILTRPVELWTQGDTYILQLVDVAHEMHAEIATGHPDPRVIDALLERIRVINAELTPLTTKFSLSLSDATRKTQELLFLAMLLAAAILVPAGIYLVGKILSASELTLREKESLLREVHIASKIQTSILPREMNVPELQIAATMQPAEVVGGDYYDVVPTDDGCWIAVGDVAGHGLKSGLVTLMTQSALAGITRARTETQPKEALCALNKVLFDNVRKRMKNDEHVTFVLLRYFQGGKVVYAGAHEDLIVWRARTQRCETVPTLGTWLGCIADIAPHTKEAELHLEKGDLLFLYTDGVIEAMNAKREQFGPDRLLKIIEERAAESAERVIESVVSSVQAWAQSPQDDVTVLAVRYQG